MKGLLSLFIVTVLALEAASQVPGFGSCPNTSVVQNFDVQRYLGRWYEIKSYPAVFQIGGRCTEANYSANPNGTVAVLNKSVRFGRPFSISGEVLPSPTADGKLTVSFPGRASSSPNYFVLGTDYNNFAVVHSCSQLSRLFNYQFAWVLSRSRTLSSDAAEQVKNILSSNGIRSAPFFNTRQTECD